MPFKTDTECSGVFSGNACFNLVGDPVTPVLDDTPPQPKAPVVSASSNVGPNPRLTIGGHIVQLSNFTKVYWPEESLTKGDLIHYYRDVAGIILPYLKDRPQSLHRHPNGVHGKSFFQKDVRQQPPPDWVETVELTSESDGKKTRTVLCQDEATLAYLANLGCIELNPWNARIQTLDRPDYGLLDLDPEKVAIPDPAPPFIDEMEEAGLELDINSASMFLRSSTVYIASSPALSHRPAGGLLPGSHRIHRTPGRDESSQIRVGRKLGRKLIGGPAGSSLRSVCLGS